MYSLALFIDNILQLNKLNLLSIDPTLHPLLIHQSFIISSPLSSPAYRPECVIHAASCIEPVDTVPDPARKALPADLGDVPVVARHVSRVLPGATHQFH